MAQTEGGGGPREMGLGDLTNLLGMGPDMILQVMATLVDAVGTGTEWTGEQIDRGGELAQQLADRIRALRGGGGE